jgi:hypothetical protein
MTFRNGVSHLHPDARKCSFNVLNRGAADLYTRISPRIQMPDRITGPHTAHAQSRYEPDLAVDGDHLPMVP